MQDPRLEKLADVLIHHSTQVQPGETVLIEGYDMPEDMLLALIRKVREVGGIPQVSIKNTRIQRELIRAGDVATMRKIGAYEAYRMQRANAYIGLRGSRNITELSDVSSEAMDIYEKHWLDPVHFAIRVPKTKWVVLRWPTPSMAQQAQQSTEAFEDFYFDVCTLDYGKMAEAVVPLQKRVEQTDRVHITGVDTDLSFSIKNIAVRACTGSRNIPDGECFTAPVKNSVNGHIHFNVPTIYRGTSFSDIALTFQDGKIIHATASDTAKLNDILNTDEGARYIGEFAIGLTPISHRPCSTFSLMKRSRGHSILRPAMPIETTPTTATDLPCIGIWSSFKPQSTAAEKSTLTTRASAKTGVLSQKTSKDSIPRI